MFLLTSSVLYKKIEIQKQHINTLERIVVDSKMNQMVCEELEKKYISWRKDSNQLDTFSAEAVYLYSVMNTL